MEPSNVDRRSVLIFHLNFSGRCTCGLVGKQLSLVSIPPVRRLADSCSQSAHALVKSQHAAAATNRQQLTKDSCRCWQQCSDQVCSYESGTKSKNFTVVFLENCQIISELVNPHPVSVSDIRVWLWYSTTKFYHYIFETEIFICILFLSKGTSSFTSNLYLIPKHELLLIYIVYRFNKNN